MAYHALDIQKLQQFLSTTGSLDSRSKANMIPPGIDSTHNDTEQCNGDLKPIRNGRDNPAINI